MHAASEPFIEIVFVGVWTLHLLDISLLDVSSSKPWSFHLYFLNLIYI
jgi:hypothetical protein